MSRPFMFDPCLDFIHEYSHEGETITLKVPGAGKNYETSFITKLVNGQWAEYKKLNPEDIRLEFLYGYEGKDHNGDYWPMSEAEKLQCILKDIPFNDYQMKKNQKARAHKHYPSS